MKFNIVSMSEEGKTLGIMNHMPHWVEGTNEFLIWGLSDLGFLKEPHMTNPKYMKAWAKTHGDDTFDEETGAHVVKDKLSLRYMNRQLEAQEKYIEALKQAAAAMEVRAEKMRESIEKVTARLEDI